MHRLHRRRVVIGLLEYLNKKHDGTNRSIREEVEFVLNGQVVKQQYLVSAWTKRRLQAKRGRKRKCKHEAKPVNDDLFKDLKAGLDCVERTARSDWWNWSDISRILF